MLAIVDLNGKQYQVEEGRYVTVDRLARDVDETIELGNVLMVVDGEQSLVGAPFVEGATIRARVLGHLRGPKVVVYKMRCKKGYRRKNGHRQDYTKLQIEVVDFPGKAERKPAEKPAEKPAKATKKPAEKKEKAPKASAKTAEKPKSEPKKAKKEEQPKAVDEAIEAQQPEAQAEVQAPEAQAPEAEETKSEE